MAVAAERYARHLPERPRTARLQLLAELARHGATRPAARIVLDMLQVDRLLRGEARADALPRRFLRLGFATTCDPHRYDARVAATCGLGVLSSGEGFVDSRAARMTDAPSEA